MECCIHISDKALPSGLSTARLESFPLKTYSGIDHLWKTAGYVDRDFDFGMLVTCKVSLLNYKTNTRQSFLVTVTSIIRCTKPNNAMYVTKSEISKYIYSYTSYEWDETQNTALENNLPPSHRTNRAYDQQSEQLKVKRISHYSNDGYKHCQSLANKIGILKYLFILLP